jgi:carbonic anhydrase
MKTFGCLRNTILKEMIDRGQIGIVGGTHDISTGAVTFYQDTMVAGS